ncbi:MAG: S8 family serine peptidase [Bacillota bacterium]|nr:S8 family serine peptidase [Bacillota bacterium]
MKKLKFLIPLLLIAFVLSMSGGAFAATISGSGDNTGVWVIKIKDGAYSMSSADKTARSVETKTQGDLEAEVIGDSLYYTTDDYETAKAMAQSDMVEYVEEDSYSTLSFVPNDTYYAQGSNSQAGSYQYALKLLNAESAWDITQGSSDVRIAVIDSGFNFTHEDGQNIKAGYDYVDEDNDPNDDFWHGTACTGIIGATTNNNLGIAGAAPNCEVYVLRCFEDKQGDNMKIATAIRDAVDVYEADVISMSFGTVADPEYLRDAVRYAYDNGVIILAATGNNGAEMGYKSNQLEYPAAYPEVIGVGSVDSKKTASSFSTKNKSTFVTAPGDSILTLDINGGYAPVNGTSFATPYVAALAALGRSVDPTLTTLEFMNVLKSTAEDKGAAGYDYSYGYGIVNYQSALNTINSRLFLDVPANAWYAEAVYDLQALGIINGSSKFAFEPERNIERGEFVKMLATAVGADTQSYGGTGGFTDVKSTDWYAPYIAWGVDNGIINGYGDGTVRPTVNITREEMCAMLNRFIAYRNITLNNVNESINFVDTSSISDWAMDNVYNLVRGGIIEGYQDNTFRPGNNATRAEVAAMVDRMIKTYF